MQIQPVTQCPASAWRAPPRIAEWTCGSSRGDEATRHRTLWTQRNRATRPAPAATRSLPLRCRNGSLAGSLQDSGARSAFAVAHPVGGAQIEAARCLAHAWVTSLVYGAGQYTHTIVRDSRHISVLGLILACVSATALSGERPNILFIMSDDHAAHALGAYEGRLAPLDPTPTLDKLASEGMLFENAFCTNSICTPSRATLLTGQYSHVNRVTTRLPDIGHIESS